MIDVFFITMALMVGTAGLPHVIIRFYTVKKVSAARVSAFWALLFIAILYTTAPAVAVFARTNLLESIPNKPYAEAPSGSSHGKTPASLPGLIRTTTAWSSTPRVMPSSVNPVSVANEATTRNAF